MKVNGCCVVFGGDAVREGKLRLDNFSGRYTARTDVCALNVAFDVNFNPLEVGQKTAQRLANNLGPGAAGSLNLAATFIFITRNRAFLADETCFWH